MHFRLLTICINVYAEIDIKRIGCDSHIQKRCYQLCNYVNFYSTSQLPLVVFIFILVNYLYLQFLHVFCFITLVLSNKLVNYWYNLQFEY